MSVQLQIAIPLLAAFAALAVIAGLRRYFRVETFVVGLSVLALGAGMLSLHFTSNQPEENVQQLEQSQISQDEVSLMVAERLILDRDYTSAANVLRDLQLKNGTDEKIILTFARCRMLQKNFASAVQLYSCVSKVEDELQQAVLLHGAQSMTNGASIAYLSAHGRNPADYGMSAQTVQKGDFDTAEDMIRDRIEKDLDNSEKTLGDESMDVIRRAAGLTSAFAEYMSGKEDTDIAAAVKKLENSLKDAPGLAKNAHIRLARLKGYVLGGDYDKIAEMADRNSSAEELVILTQLLVDGTVSTKDFSDSFVDMDTERYEEVLEICQENLDKCEGGLAKEAAKRYKENLKRLKDDMKAPVIFTLRQELLKTAAKDSVSEKSKVYLSLAKLEKDCGNDELVDGYIQDAIGSASDSNDENYRIPMDQMAGIIQGTVDSSEIKNVAQYVDDAVNHSLPLDVTVSHISGEPSDVTEGLKEDMEQDVAESTATLNIGVINKDKFDPDREIKARVQIQSDKWHTIEELEKHLKVYDCNSQITDFKLEKLEFQTSNIVLLCDVSGSMSGSTGSLKNAIISFADHMIEGERVCVVGFDDRIDFETPFSSDPAAVKGYADKIGAVGGTALFDAILYCDKFFTHDINANNIIIAMTDGQDNRAASNTEIANRIGALAANKGLTLYTLGMGSVNTDYLTAMANSGNGSFLYANEAGSLANFYDFIHGQLNNQYILTYKAKNETLNKRTLELSVEEELGSAKKTYYLKEPEITDQDQDSYNPYTVEDAELEINGLDKKFLYKSSSDQIVKLKGQGFDKGDEITVRLSGNVKYDLTAKYVDAGTYELTIPTLISVGTYNLEVSVRGDSKTFEKELTVAVQTDMKNFRFGAYNFTAQKSYVKDNGDTVLSENVMLNGWLRFRGDITIKAGYQNSGKAWITDESGCYVSYGEDTATGLAKDMASSGLPVYFYKLGEFCIYNDHYEAEEYADFPVDKIDQFGLLNLHFLFTENYGVSIYPDMIKIQTASFKYELPFQKQLLRNWDIGGSHSGEVDIDALLTPTEIDCLGKVKYDNKKDGLSFTMVSLPLNLKSFEVNLDTLRNDYALEAEVGFKALNQLEGFALKFEVKDGKFDLIGLQSKGTSVGIIEAPIPVSVGDFGFSLGGFSEWESNDSTLSNLLGTEIGFKFDVDVADLERYLPAIKDLIDTKKDVALAQLSDCELKLVLKEFRLSFDADVKLFTIIDCGKCHVDLGRFDYTNALIGYYNEKEYGLSIKITTGLEWETSNLEVGFEGSNEFTLGYPYSGFWGNGKAFFEVGWWILRADVDVEGDILIGVYKNTSGNMQFSFIVRGRNNSGQYSGFHAYVTRPSGFDIYTY